MTIPTRDGFKDLLSGMTDLSDYDDAIAAYDEMIERIVELEAQCDTMGTMLLESGCDGVVHECAVLEARIAALESDLLFCVKGCENRRTPAAGLGTGRCRMQRN